MRSTSALLLCLAFALTACHANNLTPAGPNAAPQLRPSAKGHPTFDVTKHGGRLVATLTSNDTDVSLIYGWNSVGCGPKNEHPCLGFTAGEGLKTVPATGPADCDVKHGSVNCPAEGVGTIEIVSDAKAGGDGDVTLQNGTGPQHPPVCASARVFLTLEGDGIANAWDGCHGQTIQCEGLLDGVTANSFDEIKGKCEYVERKPG